MAQNPAMCPSP